MNILKKLSIYIIVPILFFLIFELILNLMSFGIPKDTFIEKDGNYHFNRAYVEYFNNLRPAWRKYPIVVPIEKNAEDYRVFVIGASTVQGEPYNPFFAYSAQLEVILQKQLPHKKVKVYNLAKSALTSFYVADVVENLEKVKPDLIVVTCGHNEYYGYLGLGSSFVSAIPRSAMIWLNRQKVYQFIVWSMRSLAPEKTTGTLMANVIGNNNININSPLRKITVETYKDNLQRMVNSAKKIKAPIVFTSLIRNEADMPPFKAESYENLKDKTALLQTLFKEERYIEILELIGDNPNDSFAHYIRAKNLLKIKQKNAANIAFQNAIDHDLNPFRATSDIKAALQEVVKNNSQEIVFFVNTEKVFKEKSPNNIIGNNLTVDHLHPNLYGHYIYANQIAKTVAEKIVKANYQQVTYESVMQKLEYFEELEQLTELKLYSLLSYPPYSTMLIPINNKFKFIGYDKNSDAFGIKYKNQTYVLKREQTRGTSKSMLLQLFASINLKNNNIQSALQCLKAYALIEPGDIKGLNKYADLLSSENKYTLAFKYYKKALTIDPVYKPAYMGINNILLNNNNYKKLVTKYDIDINKINNDFDFQIFKGLVLIYTKEYKKGLALIRNLSEKYSKNTKAKNILAAIEKQTTNIN